MGKYVYWRSNLFTASNLGLLIIGIGIGCLLGVSVSPVVSIAITSLTGAAASIIAALSGLQEKQSSPKESDPYQISLARWSVNPWPLAVLVLGIIVGSIGGIWVRTHDLLGANIAAEVTNEVKKWTIAGLSEEEIARRLFELEHPYTPYADELNWMKVDASSGITTALAAEVEMWTQLGLDREEAARRLFEIKYPSANKSTMATVVTGTNSAWSHTGLFTLDNLVGQTECERLSGVSTNKLHEEMNNSEINEFQTLPKVVQSPETLREIVDILCEPT